MPSPLRRLSLVAAVAALSVQVVYLIALRRGFRRAATPPRGTPPDPALLPPLSVVVAARDEAARLPNLLRALGRQTHPRFEVVVVDDASGDGTAAVVAAHARHSPNVRLVRVPFSASEGKKRALTHGIGTATYPLLAITDADTAPGPRWLEHVARRHAVEPVPIVVVGYGPYRRRPDRLARFVRYETLTTAWLTAAAIGAGKPYMAVGRNLSYPRAVFDTVGGFAGSLHVVSGDDDLFVQEVANRRAACVVFLADAEAHVPSEAPPTVRAWLRQKRRHMSAGRSYRRGVQAHLTLYHGTSTLLWLLPLATGRWGVGALAARLLLHRRALAEAAERLGERDLLRTYLCDEALYVLYNLLVAPLGLLRPPRRW